MFYKKLYWKTLGFMMNVEILEINEIHELFYYQKFSFDWFCTAPVDLGP